MVLVLSSLHAERGVSVGIFIIVRCLCQVLVNRSTNSVRGHLLKPQIHWHYFEFILYSL